MSTVQVANVQAVIGSGYTSAQITAWLDAAEEILFTYLMVDNLDKAERTEITKVFEDRLVLKHFNVDEGEDITVVTMDGVDITNNYTFTVYGKHTLLIFDASGRRCHLPYNEVRVTYTAGYADINAWPQQLINAVALIVGGGISEEQKVSDVIQYSIGSKNVTFRDDNDVKMFERLTKNWLAGYKKVKIYC